MDQSMLKYAIRVDERAAYIRFYLWLWNAKKNEITFCKLFWAYVFAAPALMVRGFYTLFIKPVVFVLCLAGKGIARLLPEKKKPTSGFESIEEKSERWEREAIEKHEEREAKARKQKRQEEKAASMQKTLDGIEHVGTLAIMKARPIAEGVGAAKKRVAYAGKRTAVKVGDTVSVPLVGRGLLGLAALAGISAVIVLGMLAAPYAVAGAHGVATGVSTGASAAGSAAVTMIHSPASLWAVLGLFAAALVISAVWVLATVGILAFIARYMLAPTGRGVVKGAEVGAIVVGGGLSGFAKAMKIGYYSVKTNTCPRIEIEKRPDPIKTRRIERELDL
jgi:hypothetical protein